MIGASKCCRLLPPFLATRKLARYTLNRLRGVLEIASCARGSRRTRTPPTATSQKRLLRLLGVLSSGAGLVGSCRGHVELNRRDLFLSSRLGEHALARITSVIVSWTWVWLLRCSHGVEGQKKARDSKRQRCPFAELVVAGSLLNFDFVSEFLLQLSTRQPKSISPA